MDSRYELLEYPQQAIEWLMQVISVTPTDPQALAKLGELYDTEGDKSQAFQYYYEVEAIAFPFTSVFTQSFSSGSNNLLMDPSKHSRKKNEKKEKYPNS